MNNNEIVLIAPLNWGLGHATRMVPIIYNYRSQGHKVIIAAEGLSMKLLKKEFPDVQHIILKGFRVRYAPRPFFILYLLLQMPVFLASIIVEKQRIRKIVKEKQITTIISDNRYGLRHKKVKSILITHQIFIKLPRALKLFEPVLHSFTRQLISKFDECWIPDYEKMDESLSGELSHEKKLPANAKFIGPLSRFKNLKLMDYPLDLPAFDVVIIISGPEPNRTRFEKQMEARFEKSAQKVLMICGKPESNDDEIIPNSTGLVKVNHLNTAQMAFYLTHASKIIARSGYSTIMDLHLLNVMAELIPTPGQTEQEYLVEWYMKKQQF